MKDLFKDLLDGIRYGKMREKVVSVVILAVMTAVVGFVFWAVSSWLFDEIRGPAPITSPTVTPVTAATSAAKVMPATEEADTLVISEPDPCKEKEGQAYRECRALQRAAKKEAQPTRTPFPMVTPVTEEGLDIDLTKFLGGVLQDTTYEKALKICQEKEEPIRSACLQAAELLKPDEKGGPTPTPTPEKKGFQPDLLHAPKGGLWSFLGFLWGCWTLGWKLGRPFGLIPAIALQVAGLLLGYPALKKTAKNKRKAKGSTILPFVLDGMRALLFTPVFLVDLLIPDEWELSGQVAETAKEVGVFALFSWLTGKRAKSGKPEPPPPVQKGKVNPRKGGKK